MLSCCATINQSMVVAVVLTITLSNSASKLHCGRELSFESVSTKFHFPGHAQKDDKNNRKTTTATLLITDNRFRLGDSRR